MVTAVTEAGSAWAIAVGDAIRRSLGGHTQRWLAAQIGVDPSTISLIVRGQQAPSLEQIDGIARALGMTRRALLTVAGFVETDDNGRLIDLDTLPTYLRDIVVASIEAGLRAELGEKGIGPSDGSFDGR